MNSSAHLRRAAALTAASLASTIGLAAPSYAAAPANDTYAGRIVVGALPFSDTVDTTEATTDADDVDINANCGAPATDASVWYEVTPATDGFLLADVSASDYSAGVLVAIGSPGAFEIVACGPGGAIWEAFAGTTYTLLAIDDQFDGAGNGGTLQLTIDNAPPPPSLEVMINSTGRFTRNGSAIVSGTFTCDSGASGFLDMLVTQTAGRFRIQGFGGTSLECDGTTRPWSVEVLPDNGKFAGGRAATVTFAFACNEFLCSDEFFDERTIQLRGR